ncbi:leucine-rich repeat and calponin homology domain-containing protein 1-like isoform X3 [Polyodon spathula]|uniref:leucine-rich repeat and calponin homology domain-containing protein 1-like isoform X3 n=1 Tax=Polyodon spathula TaxID=7913 RepID=UPI001B7E8500|nr:leucine-rich repeat and calponin homology domain-containing protein 1-like isoform X3 [Polyodon spathula]
MATVGSEPQPHSQLASGIVQTNMNSLGCSNLPLNRGLERALEEAANSGLLNLSARKLKEFPRTALNHDLTDTVQADLSKNRLTEVPVEVCHFVSLEILNLYHNCVKVIPDAIVSLHMLTYLNLSRNQLSALPACLCGLPLKVLIASNNKLGALPEEIGQLKQLMELDISCNEVTALPQQIGQLKALRELNVRRNYLSVLPEDLVSLPLVKLDFSCNKVAVIPVCYRKMSRLQTLQLDNNPLQSPPAQICIKGKVHIFKYLHMEACRIDKTVDSLYLPVIGRLSLSQPAAGSIEDIDQNRKQDTDSGLGSDNGDKRLSATEPSDEDTVSLNAPMSNITEEESFSKEDSSEHMNPFKEESDQESVKLIENNNPEENPQDKFVYGGPGLSTPFVTYMKGRAAEFDEPLRIEEDTSWATEPMTNPPDNQEIHIEMINQLREAVELLQDPNRLNMNTEDSTGVQLYPVHTVTTENLNSSVNGQTYQDVSMTPTRKSIGGELEFQKKRELILGKARVEAQLACQRFERQMSNQSNSKTLEGQNDVRRASVDGGEDKTPASSPTANTPFGLKPRSVFLRTPRKLESMDPQFTIRRKMEQMREELDLMDQLRENIESRLKVVLPVDLGSSLMDGVVLCHLVNHIRPRSVVSIHVPSPAVPKLSMAKCRRNVENFLDACRKMGVPEADLCTPYDILQSDIRHIQKTVCALLARGDTSTQPPPAPRPWDFFGFGLLNLFCLVLLFVAYNWSVLI